MNAVDQYIANFPEDVQERMIQIRAKIFEIALEVEESISYAMPAYKTNGKPLVYYAGYKNHIGFYATPAGHTAFSSELARFKQGKGSVQFPLNQPLPIDLIEKIIAFKSDLNKTLKKR